MAAAFILFVTTVVALLLTWAYQSYKRNKLFGKIPKLDGTLPILGNAHQIETDGTKFYEQVLQYSKELGQNGIYILWLGIIPMICVCRAEDAEVLLSSSKHMEKSPLYRFLHPWLGTGLLTSTGDKWKSRRKMLTPTFHFKILNDFLEVFNEQTDVLIQKLGKKAGHGSFNIFNDITLCALDIICETAMGRDVNAQSDSDSSYVKCVYKMTEFAQNRMKKPWYWNDLMYKIIGHGTEHDKCLHVLHSFTKKVIKEKKAEIAKHGSKVQKDDYHDSAEEDRFTGAKKHRLAFLDMLLHMADDGQTLSADDIREEVDTFMFEGHDTTAAAMNWATYLIGKYKDVQDKLQEELDSIFGDSERYPTMEDLKDMKYLELCIKEALRLYPSVPMFARTLSEDAYIGGHVIPKGTSGTILVHAIHRNPNYFPDPEVFDPDRFSDANRVGRNPFSYIPFSAGLRNCIGQKFAMMEEKVLLSGLFRNFTVESIQKEEDLRPMGTLILRPEHGITVKLTNRR